MHVKLVKTTARAVAAGAVVALGLASAPAALATPTQGVIQVPCDSEELADAISGAASGDILNLDVTCTYVLTHALPHITKDLTITGGGFATLLRSFAYGTRHFSILKVTRDVSLVVDHVNFVNGDAKGRGDGVATTPRIKGRQVITPSNSSSDGGAIDNQSGAVTVIGGVFRHNHASSSGGAIYSNNQLRVSDAAFIGNSAQYGGAIYNDDDAIVTGGTFAGNTAYEGGGIYNDGGARVADVTFRHNEAGGGGGVFNNDHLLLADNTLLGNHATNDCGGGLYNNDIAFVKGDAFTFNTSSDCGGGIYNEDETIVADTTFTGNAAQSGGGFYNDYRATLADDTVHHNLANEGGGIYNNDTLTVRTSEIVSNKASSAGGGIFEDGTTTLIQSNVTGNTPDNCEPLNSIAGCTN